MLNPFLHIDVAPVEQRIHKSPIPHPEVKAQPSGSLWRQPTSNYLISQLLAGCLLLEAPRWTAPGGVWWGHLLPSVPVQCGHRCGCAGVQSNVPLTHHAENSNTCLRSLCFAHCGFYPPCFGESHFQETTSRSREMFPGRTKEEMDNKMVTCFWEMYLSIIPYLCKKR